MTATPCEDLTYGFIPRVVPDLLPPEPTVRTIPLRNKQGDLLGEAKVDAEDYELLRAYKWYFHNSGYATRSTYKKIDGKYRYKTISMHRMVLGLPQGRTPVVDHINRDKLDNRKSNLRTCSSRENAQNRTPQHGGTSQYRGVSWDTKQQKWIATGTLDGKQHYLGGYRDEKRAWAARQVWEKAHMPFAVQEDQRDGDSAEEEPDG